MNQKTMVLKTVLFGVLLIFGINICLCIAGAFLIERRIAAIDTGPVLAVMSVLVSGTVCGVYCIRKTENPLIGYLCGAVALALFVVMGIAAMGNDVVISSLLKSGAATLIGVFLGNFFGRPGHNRLRKNRRKRALHTK